MGVRDDALPLLIEFNLKGDRPIQESLTLGLQPTTKTGAISSGLPETSRFKRIYRPGSRDKTQLREIPGAVDEALEDIELNVDREARRLPKLLRGWLGQGGVAGAFVSVRR